MPLLNKGRASTAGRKDGRVKERECVCMRKTLEGKRIKGSSTTLTRMARNGPNMCL